jgi:hypothetical protein
MNNGQRSRGAALQRKIAICLEVLINLIYLAMVKMRGDAPARSI